MSRKITVALAGNPNSGKTTLFNSMTGARQHVGNYPGVTVEKKEGSCRHKDFEMNIVDLPGTYSLSAYSIEELVTRNFIIDEKPDVVVDVLDAANIERNLYLATQLMELEVPLLLVFNMSDVAKQRGLVFDLDNLSLLLGTPIVETIGNKGRGVDDLLDAIVNMVEGPAVERVNVHYGDEIEEELDKITGLLENEKTLTDKYHIRWLGARLLEQDKEIIEKVDNTELLEAIDKSSKHIKAIFGDKPSIVMADRRYGFISGACQEAVKNTVEARHDVSDKIDAVLINRVVGLPIFVVLMYLVFQLTFAIGEYPMGWIESGFGWLGEFISGFWAEGSASIIRSLLVDGIIGGVGGVIVFLPNILLLFAAIAFLEDSGYMARAAFIMDRIMHKLGLHGKSFIPMLIGFGCSIPAIMATRILENRRNRITTIMIIPLMSCGARFPIYALIIPAFFAGRYQGLVLWLIYLFGVIMAIVCARLLRGTLLKGETVPFVMELPPYRMPTMKGLWIHTWTRGWLYLKKAGTVILGISIVLWMLSSFPRYQADPSANMTDEQIQTRQLEGSIVGHVGRGMEPAIKPLGFDWKIGTALVGAMAAKEVFVSQMSIVYSLGDADETSDALRARLHADYNALQGFCVMLFCLISAPCMATVAITRRETGSWKWAVLQWGGLTAIAYVITLMVYQVGSLFM